MQVYPLEVPFGLLALLRKVEGLEAISFDPTPSESSLVLKWRRIEV